MITQLHTSKGSLCPGCGRRNFWTPRAVMLTSAQPGEARPPVVVAGAIARRRTSMRGAPDQSRMSRNADGSYGTAAP